MKKDILKTFKITFLALVVTLGVNYVFAWTGPLLPAPNGNTPTPINVGTTDQVKNSGLGINALSVFGASYFQGNVGVGVISPTSKLDVSGNISATGDVTASGNVKGSNVCIGADCRASWPSGAGSTAWNDITGKPAGFADNVDNVASSIGWNSITGKPVGFADNVDNTGVTTEVDPLVLSWAKTGTSSCGTLWVTSEIFVSDQNCLSFSSSYYHMCTPNGFVRTSHNICDGGTGGDGNDQITEDLNFLRNIIQDNKDSTRKGIENGKLH